MNVFQGAFFYVGGFDNLWPLLSSCFHLRKKRVVFETLCVCSAMYAILKRRKKSFYLLVMCYNLLLCRKFRGCSYLVVGKYIVLTVYTVLISKGVYLLDKIEGLLFYPPIHKIIRALNPFRSDYDTRSPAVASWRWNVPNTWNKQAAGTIFCSSVALGTEVDDPTAGLQTRRAGNMIKFCDSSLCVVRSGIFM